jgi:hypothetical protein
MLTVLIQNKTSEGSVVVAPLNKELRAGRPMNRMRAKVLVNKQPWDCYCIDHVIPHDPITFE